MRLDADAVRLVLKKTAELARRPQKDETQHFVALISLVPIIVGVVRIIVDGEMSSSLSRSDSTTLSCSGCHNVSLVRIIVDVANVV